MKIKKIKRLGLNKETIANLDIDEMRFLYGGDFIQAQAEPAYPVTYSCNPCAEPGEPVYPKTQTCNSTCTGPIPTVLP
jgi:natural product precursor